MFESPSYVTILCNFGAGAVAIVGPFPSDRHAITWARKYLEGQNCEWLVTHGNELLRFTPDKFVSTYCHQEHDAEPTSNVIALHADAQQLVTNNDDDNTVVLADDYFGVCPHCYKTDGYINVGRGHWFYCKRHKICWLAGTNLFESWKLETETEQKTLYNELGFGEFMEIKPFYLTANDPSDVPF